VRGRLVSLAAAGLPIALGIACGDSAEPAAATPDAETPDPDSGSVLTDGGFSFSDAPVDGASIPTAGEVFGHSATTLYKLEPIGKTVTTIGTLDCVTVQAGPLPCGDGLWDIAIDKNGQMYGTALSVSDQICSPAGAMGRLVTIDKATAHCTIVKSTVAGQKYPNSLTFLPEGTIAPNVESLVGYVGADYMQIDVATGAQTKIGSLNPNSTGQTWYSSGDVVAVKGGKTYLTAKPDPSANYAGTDSLLEVDPKTGQALAIVGDTTFPKLWGLGFWGGTAYGFSATGQLASIDVKTGKGTAIPLTGVPGGLQLWGAGSTTVAPVDLPK